MLVIVLFVLMLQLNKWNPWMTEYAKVVWNYAHTFQNTVLYNFWFKECCLHKWTPKSKQFLAASVLCGYILVFPVVVKHSVLSFAHACPSKVGFSHLFLSISSNNILSHRTKSKKSQSVFALDTVVKCAAQKHFMEEAQTLNDSNCISPTTLIVCEVSKMLPQDTGPHTATLPCQSAWSSILFGWPCLPWQ